MDTDIFFPMFFMGPFIMFILGLIVLQIVATWKIFEKAGQQGWKVLIPIYNMVVWMRIINKPTYWVILMFIPWVGIIWNIWSRNLMSKVFGKDEGFTVGLIFLPFIFLPILAFGNAVYTNPDETYNN